MTTGACWRFHVLFFCDLSVWVDAGGANRWRRLVSTPASNLSLVTTASRKRHMPGMLKALQRDMKVSASWDRRVLFWFPVFVLSLDVRRCHNLKPVSRRSRHPESALRHVLLTLLAVWLWCDAKPSLLLRNRFLFSTQTIWHLVQSGLLVFY